MPVTPTYPGVYIEEIPSGVRTITGVATSIAAFLGRAPRGLTDKPVTINSFGDFERQFGGLDSIIRWVTPCGISTSTAATRPSSCESKGTRSGRGECRTSNWWPRARALGQPGCRDRGNGITDDIAAHFGIAKADLFNLTVVRSLAAGTEEVTSISPRRSRTAAGRPGFG